MVVKASQSQSVLVICKILVKKSPALREPGTEQARGILRLTLAVHMCALKGGRIRELFSHLFRKWNFTATLLSDARCLQLPPDNSQVEPHLQYEMSVPVALEAQLYFLEVDLIDR